MKMSRAQWEYITATLLLAVIASIFIPALLAARASVRDDLRRADLANLKRALEQYYNEQNHYGLPPVQQQTCTRSDDTTSWFFGDSSPLLKDQFIDAIPHDVRERRGHVYQYCATDHNAHGAIQGFYLQAELETEQEDIRAFDEDEQRKFHYRVLHENNDVLYRVCGGTETQCMTNEEGNS